MGLLPLPWAPAGGLDRWLCQPGAGVQPEHPKPLPGGLPNLALGTTHPPPDQGGQPFRRYPLWPPGETEPDSRNHNWKVGPTPNFLGPSLPCAPWRLRSQRGSHTTQAPSPLALAVLQEMPGPTGHPPQERWGAWDLPGQACTHHTTWHLGALQLILCTDLSWIALPDLGWLEWIWAGRTEFNFMRTKPRCLSRVQVSMNKVLSLLFQMLRTQGRGPCQVAKAQAAS